MDPALLLKLRLALLGLFLGWSGLLGLLDGGGGGVELIIDLVDSGEDLGVVLLATFSLFALIRLVARLSFEVFFLGLRLLGLLGRGGGFGRVGVSGGRIRIVLDRDWLQLDEATGGGRLVPRAALDHSVVSLDHVSDFELTCHVAVKAEHDRTLGTIDLCPAIFAFL